MLQATDLDFSTQILFQSSSTLPDPLDPQRTQLSHEFQTQSRPGTPENDLLNGELLLSLSKNLWEYHGF